jgi:hypothetical protein
MKCIPLAVLTSILITQSVVAAEIRYECPPEIRTVQSIEDNTPVGWEVIQESHPKHWQDSIMVFDGPPKELASLVPDNERNQDIKKTVWTFSKEKERSIWFTCSYHWTDIQLAKELPKEITKCKPIPSKRKPVTAIGLVCK